jgi:hypothetical protein
METEWKTTITTRTNEKRMNTQNNTTKKTKQNKLNIHLFFPILIERGGGNSTKHAPQKFYYLGKISLR